MPRRIYDSRTGNTRKLAEAMAAELGIKAEDVKDASLDAGDGILFLGSGCYGSQPGKNMLKFIETHDLQGRRVALFGTSCGGAGNEVKVMAEALKGKGATVIGSCYCRGKFLLFSGGHPDAADIGAARKFARDVAKR